jgi:CelD/BcsL family acetyltransferase involved in cellulose biosynthesis
LKESWDIIIERHGAHQPFLCHDWFRMWLKHFQGPAELCIVIITKQETPIFIAPLIRKIEKYKKIARARKIEFIGNHHSPVKSFIFGEKGTLDIINSLNIFFNMFKTHLKDWDIIELDSIPEERDLVTITKQSLLSTGIPFRSIFCYNDWMLDNIKFSGDDYLSSRSNNIKKEIKRRTKRLQEEGIVNFVIGDAETDFDKYNEIYHIVRSKSWKHAESDINFLTEFRKWAMEKGLLKFSFLYVNDSPISCHIRLISNNTAYLLDSVYDQSYKKYSPTTLLRAMLMKYIIERENVTTIDTIRGDETYKIEWTSTKRRRMGFTVFNSSVKGQFFRFLMMVIVPAVRKMMVFPKKLRANP